MAKRSAQKKEEKYLNRKEETEFSAEGELSGGSDTGEREGMREEPAKAKEENGSAVEEELPQTDEVAAERDKPEKGKEQDGAELVESLKREIAEREDRMLRLQAELENFKRRNAQEIKTRFKYAGQELAVSILPGLDNLERALEQAREEENEQMREFITGIEMVRQQFYDALKQHNIERTFPVHEPFNPNVHEAMGVVETDDVEPDHISRVFQAGYIYHDRVIRPAVVQVAKKK